MEKRTTQHNAKNSLSKNKGFEANNMNQTCYKTINTRLALNVADPDEQFILDIIRVAKQESIIELVDNLRLQESKCTMLIRMLERYRFQLDNKNLMKNDEIKNETINTRQTLMNTKIELMKADDDINL